MDTRETAEAEIFRLRRAGDLYLQAGNTEAFTKIQIWISILQERHGATKGQRERDNDNRTD